MQLQDACGHLGGDGAEESLFDDLGLAYAVLLTAMVSGRIVWGIVRFVLAGLTGGSFPFSAFLSGALFTAVPGIVAQLVLIPLLLTALQKAGFAD